MSERYAGNNNGDDKYASESGRNWSNRGWGKRASSGERSVPFILVPVLPASRPLITHRHTQTVAYLSLNPFIFVHFCRAHQRDCSWRSPSRPHKGKHKATARQKTKAMTKCTRHDDIDSVWPRLSGSVVGQKRGGGGGRERWQTNKRTEDESRRGP